MKKTILPLLFLLAAIVAACTHEYGFCDDRTRQCYTCDSVGCSPVGTVPSDAGIVDTAITPADDVPVIPCFSESDCLPISRCINGECHVPCLIVDDCLRVDVSLQVCTQAGLCSTNH